MASVPTLADLIASDSFSYGAGAIDGTQNGGTGNWIGGWNGPPPPPAPVVAPPQVANPATPLSLTVGSSVISGGTSAIRIDGQSSSDLMVRQISPLSETFYFSFLMRYEGSSFATDGPDFLGVWFDNDATNSGNEFRNANTTNIGIVGNAASEFFARNNGTEAATTRTGGGVLANTTYLIAGEIGKSGAPNTAFNTLKLWVWRTGASASSGPITFSTNVAEVKYIGVRAANLESGTADRLWIDEFKIGTTLGDVAPVPLPAPVIAAAVLMGGTGLCRRRRKVTA